MATYGFGSYLNRFRNPQYEVVTGRKQPFPIDQAVVGLASEADKLQDIKRKESQRIAEQQRSEELQKISKDQTTKGTMIQAGGLAMKAADVANKIGAFDRLMGKGTTPAPETPFTAPPAGPPPGTTVAGQFGPTLPGQAPPVPSSFTPMPAPAPITTPAPTGGLSALAPELPQMTAAPEGAITAPATAAEGMTAGGMFGATGIGALGGGLAQGIAKAAGLKDEEATAVGAAGGALAGGIAGTFLFPGVGTLIGAGSGAASSFLDELFSAW